QGALTGGSRALELFTARPLDRAPAARAFVKYCECVVRARQSGVVAQLLDGALGDLAQALGPLGEARGVRARELRADVAGRAREDLVGAPELPELDERL